MKATEVLCVRKHYIHSLLLFITLLAPGTYVIGQRHMVQLKTFDENLQAIRNIEVSVNEQAFVKVGNKGIAFLELDEKELPPTSIKISDESLEAASWNYSRGTIEIIIRKKSYKIYQISLVDGKGQPLSEIEVEYAGKNLLKLRTDKAGILKLPLGISEGAPLMSRFRVAGYNMLKFSDGPERTLEVVKQSQENISANEPGPLGRISFDISKLDSIQSLTVFYSVFKEIPIQSLSSEVRRKVDAKFRQLVRAMEDSIALRSEDLFLKRISDTSLVRDDIVNLIGQASTEGAMLQGQRSEFDEKIKIITSKLDNGVGALDVAARERLLSDLTTLQAMLSQNENRFYKNQEYYKEVISSLREKYFDFEEMENKLSISEAQRLEQQKVFRQRLIITVALVLLFGILIIRLVYFSNQLRKEKRKLQVANEEIQNINENLESLVRQRTRLLTEANQELDTFLYRASHDLRSPVCSIIGLCNLASHFSSGEARDLLDKVVQTTTGMDKMLKKLSLISEINQPSNFSEVHIASTIDNVRDQLLVLIDQCKIRFVVECDPMLTIHTYPHLFEAIISNVIENAVVFTSLKKSDELRVEVKVWLADHFIHVQVRDTGIGVEKKITDRLFNMFFKGNVFSKGNGLGLYIVQKSVIALGGSVQLQSEPGVFTQVEVVLPLENPEQVNMKERALSMESSV